MIVKTSLQSLPSVCNSVSCVQVLVWAVATSGEAVYRVGVTREEPAGAAWSTVQADILFQSVTIGCDASVWLVGHC